MAIPSRKSRKRHRGQRQLRSSEQPPTNPDSIPQSRAESETNSKDVRSSYAEETVTDLEKNEDSTDESKLLPPSLQSFYAKITGSRKAMKKPDSMGPSNQSTVYNALSTLIDTINDWDHSKKIVINPEQINPLHASFSLLDQLAEEVKTRLQFAEEKNTNVLSSPQSNQEVVARGDAQSSSNNKTSRKKKSKSFPVKIPTSDLPHKREPGADSRAAKWKSKIYWSTFFTHKSMFDQSSIRYLWNDIDVGCSKEEALRNFVSLFNKMFHYHQLGHLPHHHPLDDDEVLPDHSDNEREKCASSSGLTQDNTGKHCKKYSFCELQDALLGPNKFGITAAGVGDHPQISSSTLPTSMNGDKPEKECTNDRCCSRLMRNGGTLLDSRVSQMQLAETDGGLRISLKLDRKEKNNDTSTACSSKSSPYQKQGRGSRKLQSGSKKETIQNYENERKEAPPVSTSPSEILSNFAETDSGSQISLSIDSKEEEDETINTWQGKSPPDQTDHEGAGSSTLQSDSNEETIASDGNEKEEASLASKSPSKISSNFGETDSGLQISLSIDSEEEKDETINICQGILSPHQNDNEGAISSTLQSGSKKETIANDGNEKEEALPTSTSPSEILCNLGETDSGSQISLSIDFKEEEDETINMCEDRSSPDQNDNEGSSTLQSGSEKETLQNYENEKKEAPPASTSPSEIPSISGETDSGLQTSLSIDSNEEEDKTISKCQGESSPDQNDNEGSSTLQSGSNEETITSDGNEKEEAPPASKSPSEISSNSVETYSGLQISLSIDSKEEEDKTISSCQGESSPDQNDNEGSSTLQSGSEKETIQNYENEKKEAPPASPSPSDILSNLGEIDSGSQISLSIDPNEEEDETINLCQGKSSPDQSDIEGSRMLLSGSKKETTANDGNEKEKALPALKSVYELLSKLEDLANCSQETQSPQRDNSSVSRGKQDETEKYYDEFPFVVPWSITNQDEVKRAEEPAKIEKLQNIGRVSAMSLRIETNYEEANKGIYSNSFCRFSWREINLEDSSSSSSSTISEEFQDYIREMYEVDEEIVLQMNEDRKQRKNGGQCTPMPIYILKTNSRETTKL